MSAHDDHILLTLDTLGLSVEDLNHTHHFMAVVQFASTAFALPREDVVRKLVQIREAAQLAAAS